MEEMQALLAAPRLISNAKSTHSTAGLGARHLASAAGRVVTSAPRRSRLPQKAALEITPNAARRVLELLRKRQEQEDVIAVRLGIKTRGCNGLSYTMNYATSKAKFEEEVEQHGARVFVEPKALMHVIGTTMDYVDDELSAEFVFHNPNAEASCGCGESFTVSTKPGEAANMASGTQSPT